MTTARNPRTIVPDTRKRDILISVVVGLVLLALITAGMVILTRERGKPSANQLTGTIVAKHASGEREQEIRVGRKGLAAQETDSGYAFEIRVDKDGRTYTVPVPKRLFDSRKVGDKQNFIRPPSEQR